MVVKNRRRNKKRFGRAVKTVSSVVAIGAEVKRRGFRKIKQGSRSAAVSVGKKGFRGLKVVRKVSKGRPQKKLKVPLFEEGQEVFDLKTQF